MKINGKAVGYHQFCRNCISPKRSFAYHQVAKSYARLRRDDIQPLGADDIHAEAWWYTKSATWIKNNLNCPLRNNLGYFWCGWQDLNLHEVAFIRSLVLCVCQFRHIRNYSKHMYFSIIFLKYQTFYTHFYKNFKIFFLCHLILKYLALFLLFCCTAKLFLLFTINFIF